MGLWKIQGGREGDREEFALSNSVAVIGWTDVGDLSAMEDRATLAAALARGYPDAKAKTRSNWESQLWPFAHAIALDDWIAMPLKARPAVAIARCAGPYTYRADFAPGHRHTLPVHWLTELPRAAFDQDLLYSLGAFMTVCRIKRNNAEARVAALALGKPVRASAAPDAAEPEDVESSAPRDIEQDARDQVRDHIQRRFAGHALTRLIAAILELQGYRARVSPEGVDGGVDIIAGRGALGFEPPLLAVQVKSGDAPSDAKVVRELRGAMQQFGAEHGLFVSWAGYRQGVEREASRAYFQMRLWDGDDVIRAIETHYDALPEAIQAELPLKRVWALVLGEDG